MKIIAVVVAVLLLAGCSSGKSAPKSAAPTALLVRGTVTVVGHNTLREDAIGGLCWTTGNVPEAILAHPTPFDDVKAGAQVVVTDAKGVTVAIARLESGVAVTPASGDEVADCSFSFATSSVPGGSTFYGVKVAGEQSVQFTGAEIAAPQITFGP